MSKWMDRRTLWQFTLIYVGSMLLVVVVGGLVIGKLTGRHVDPGFVVGGGAVFTAGQTVVGAWARQRRLHRGSSRERLSDPGRMRPYAGLPSEPEQSTK